MQTIERGDVVIGAGYQRVDGALRRGRRTAVVIRHVLTTGWKPATPGLGG